MACDHDQAQAPCKGADLLCPKVAREYEDASPAAILDAMRIAQGSRYKTYGATRAVYLSALDHCDRAVVAPTVTASQTVRPVRGWHGWSPCSMHPQVRFAMPKTGAAVLLCNAAVDPGPGDGAGPARVLAMFDRLETGLRAALGDDAYAQGWNAAQISDMVKSTLAVYVALRVLSCAGAPLTTAEATAGAYLASFADRR